MLSQAQIVGAVEVLVAALIIAVMVTASEARLYSYDTRYTGYSAGGNSRERENLLAFSSCTATCTITFTDDESTEYLECYSNCGAGSFVQASSLLAAFGAAAAVWL
jgi:hypothetical protein